MFVGTMLRLMDMRPQPIPIHHAEAGPSIEHVGTLQEMGTSILTTPYIAALVLTFGVHSFIWG
jgi:hypothetical protein